MNFEVGDFVLVRKAQNKGHKLSFRWRGPRRITRVIADTVYEVTSLFDEHSEVVHAARLIKYRSDLDGMQVSDKLLAQAEQIESKFEMVEKLLDVSESEDGIFYSSSVAWPAGQNRLDLATYRGIVC